MIANEAYTTKIDLNGENHIAKRLPILGTLHLSSWSSNALEISHNAKNKLSVGEQTGCDLATD